MEVSTTSVRLNGAAWGNIRSIVDGAASTTLEDSTGTPVFYLPTPDPTNVDVLHDTTIALSFSEASLSERLDPETHTKVCNGLGTCMSWRGVRLVPSCTLDLCGMTVRAVAFFGKRGNGSIP